MSKVIIKIQGAEAARQLSAGKLDVLAGKAAKGGAIAATKLGKGSAGVFAQGGGQLALHGNAAGLAPGQAMSAATPVKGFGTAAFKMGAGSVTKAGTIWSGTGTSLGLGVGLGAYGPLLLMAALGLVATGVYIYIRSRSVQPSGDETAES